MKDIAAEVGLKAQFEVTRLLKVDDFLANVRQHILKQLRDSVVELAQEYACPDRLQNLDKRVEAVLNEQIDQIITKPRANSSACCSAKSLFIQRLCRIIQRLE
jgi:hypothetical protein